MAKCLKITGDIVSYVRINESVRKLPKYGEVIEKPAFYLYAGWCGYYYIDKESMRGILDDGVSRRESKLTFEVVDIADE